MPSIRPAPSRPFQGSLPLMLIAATLIARAPAVESALAVAVPRCEYRDRPLGIDTPAPRLSWELTATRRGERQSAYQVLVASTPALLDQDRGDLWDPGKVADQRTCQVEYAGKALASHQRCFWKVRAWDRDGRPSAWSAPAEWSMGLLTAAEWKAAWIGFDAAYDPPASEAADDARYALSGLDWVRCPAAATKPGVFTAALRKAVALPEGRIVKSAVLALYAHNSCAAAVNGTAIGEAVHWDRTARLDAAAALHAGGNVIALRLDQTDGLAPAVVGKLVVRFTSGDDLVVPVDASWKAAQQPADGWDRAGFADQAWAQAEALKGTPWKGPPALGDLARLPAPFLRTEFTLAQPARRATAYVTALGTYELHLNGQRVGRDELTPGWPDFRKRVPYQTYDVTALVRTGANALGAVLGDGWYASDLAHLARRNIYGGRPRLLAQLVIEQADGSVQTIVSDGGWKAAYGPIRHADLILGAELDQRLAMPGWDTAGFADQAWRPVVTGGNAPPIIQAAVTEPSRRHEELPALNVSEPRPGCWTFDLGQNMVGWVRLKVSGAAGQRITVRHAEMLNADGTIYTASLRSAPAADFYTLAGGGEEVLEPPFTFHGFRYVEVRGLTGKPALGAVTGIVVHSEMRRTGDFSCSSALVSQLYRNIIWGQKGNHLEIPTDCPQRDERMGWTGDTQFFAPTGAYNFDVAGFFTRWLTTICEDDQLPDGSFPHVVPDLMGSGGATAWGDAALLCTWNVYQVYSDTRVIAAHWPALDRYMTGFLAKHSKDGLTTVGGFGDWLNLGGGAAGPAIDTAYHAHLARIMAEMARAIGRTADAERYAALHETVKAAFARAFVQADGSLKDCSQTGYALAFTMDLLPAALRAQAAGQFVEQIKRFDWHLATGFIGTPRLLPGLHAAGRDDVAYRLLLQESFPSWLFQVKNGATTMWERWDGWTPEKGFQTIEMNSFNHYAFGAVAEYLYGGVGGIRAASPGYRTIVIAPAIQDGLDWAKTSFHSIQGPISTAWKRSGGKLDLEVEIPPGTTATVRIPGSAGKTVLEGGLPVEHADGVRVVGPDGDAVVFAVGSGRYAFSVGR